MLTTNINMRSKESEKPLVVVSQQMNAAVSWYKIGKLHTDIFDDIGLLLNYHYCYYYILALMNIVSV